MNAKHCAAALLLLASSTAAAGERLPTVEVSAESENSIFISCSDPAKPSTAEVMRVLSLNTDEQARTLAPKLMKAAAAGCAAGIPRIVVTATQGGRDLTWSADS